MKLLIVDDSAMIRRSINEAYKGSVFTEIETAADGLLALTIFKKFLPDVVTLDITMPHMDGLAAMSQMLEIKPNTTILVISALADHHTAIEALMRGAQQFICKPFSNLELKEALDTLLEDSNSETNKDQPTHKMESSSIGSGLDDKSFIPTPKAVPTEANYPSGYVAPPKVHSLKQGTPKDAVSRQMSFRQSMSKH